MMVYLFWLIVTLIIYISVVLLKKRYPNAWLNPIVVCPIALILLLWLTHTDYLVYHSATQPITFFLGPVEIALVIPLYKYLSVLKRHFFQVITGVLVGTVAGVFIVIWVANFFDLSPSTVVSLAPKSTTAPMAMSVSQFIGGYPELTAIFAMMTALIGMMIGPPLISWLGIKNKVVKGLAMGTAASMVGAVKAAQWGELEGAMGVLGMTLVAIIMPIIAGLLFVYL
ncbi:LrgB family protein [Ammoniphilus sp. YIM 78166]|uniref:LrgB family protein n=1 Tax=Ammoniphilus sp. YIM 78166 TaxID=1644106 RepID=UPI00106F8061|nr:LrgB family protein [Ammoniphilus sp. YIM 78166]